MKIHLNDITHQLYNQFNSRIELFVGDNPTMIKRSNNEFENFVAYLHKREDKILKYLLSDFPSSDLELRAPTENYIFNFTIHKDKSSSFNIQYIKSLLRKYEDRFLLSKISDKLGYVYILKSDFGYKIGCTSRLKERVSHFNLKLPFKFSVVSIIKCDSHNKIESLLHDALKHKRINGEWFDLEEKDFIDMDILLKNINLKREKFKIINQ